MTSAAPLPVEPDIRRRTLPTYPHRATSAAHLPQPPDNRKDPDMTDQTITAHTMATTYTVSALPLDHRENGLFAVTVEWRGHYDGSDKWAVCRHQQCLDAKGEWDWESRPSEREDDWLATHRFDLDTALRLAQQVVPTITVNGFTPADVLARDAR